MLTAKAKNPFAPTPPVLSEKSPLEKAEDAEAGKRLLQGRTRARVESVTADLDAAKIEREQARQVLAERIGDELDTTAAMDVMTQAESEVRMLEEALIVWKQKDDAALAAWSEAQNQVKIEIEAAAAKAVIALGPRSAVLFESVREFSLDLARATEALRVAGGDDKYTYPMTQIRVQFEFFLKLASHRRTTEVPSAMKMYEDFPTCLIQICGIGTQP